MPIDGTGYGKSQYWEWNARNIAQSEDEACKHLFDSLPKVTFKYDSNINNTYHLSFRVKCPKCRQRFYRTETILRRKFIEFYAMDSSEDVKLEQDLKKL